MDKNYKVILRYDGTRYDGWQKQGNSGRTIQGKLESVLGKLAGRPVEVHGSGRTDAGVHALGQVANFRLPDPCSWNLEAAGFSPRTRGESDSCPAGRLRRYLNRYLPEDIEVVSAGEAPQRFHSRLNAVSKTYLYQIETAEKKNVFERKYVYGLGRRLDIAAVRAAAICLEGTHDFRGYSSLKRVKKSTVRTLNRIAVKEEGTKVLLTFEGNGFLYHMVRILVGTLVEAGLHERSPESVVEPLDTGDRALAGETAPAEGLFLAEVTYREINFQSVQ